MELTKHLTNDNQNRIEFIKNNIGFGKIIDEFFWNRGHKDGAEMHFVTDTGIIIIVNAITGRLITFEIARPNQIKRLYAIRESQAPKWLLKIAREHADKGWNYM